MVVSVKSGKQYDLYVGRKNVTYGLDASKWANPYDRETYGRDEACRLYEIYVRNGPLWNDLEELDGLTLACWCGPKQNCHAKILLKLLNEKKISNIFN